MFGSYEAKLQPSEAKYSPLSMSSYDHCNQIGDDGHVEPGTEEACGDKPSPSFTTRIFFVLLGTLIAALVVGLLTDVLGSISANYTRIEGPPSWVKIKQFAPQSKHFAWAVHQTLRITAELSPTSSDNNNRLLREASTDGAPQRPKQKRLGCPDTHRPRIRQHIRFPSVWP